MERCRQHSGHGIILVMKRTNLFCVFIPLIAAFAIWTGCSKSTSADSGNANSTPTEQHSAPVTQKPASVELRGGISCDNATTQTALELKKAGWTYIMPEPKSAKAAWGIRDGRTTWWVGYWTNERNNSTSSIQPTKNAQGQLVGDGQGNRSWRRGGSPAAPSQIEWLCSKSGGVPPN
jgi:hypothetical protein